MLAVSPKVDARFLPTIPVELETLIDRHMRHDGRSVNWNRAGYGSKSVVMDKGYDSTRACLIPFGTKGGPRAAEFGTPTESIPWALSYRKLARIEGQPWSKPTRVI